MTLSMKIDKVVNNETLEKAEDSLVSSGWEQFWSFHPSSEKQFKEAGEKVNSLRKISYEVCVVCPIDYKDVQVLYRKNIV